MHLVVDAFAVRHGSAAVIVENLLRGWTELDVDDRITLLTEAEPEFAVPAKVEVVQISRPVPGAAGALWLRSFGLRSAARRLKADAVLSGVTASAFVGTGTPRGVVVYDVRHELRPQQFSRGRRLVRRVSYGWSFRTADGLYCISERTRDDLLRRRAWARKKAVVTHLGADHADRWVSPAGAPRYVLAFGHFQNKNVDAVLEAWASFCRTDADLTLRLVGLGRADRAAAEQQVARLGISQRVELMPWLDDDEFAACFAGASLVLFPSDFEGFGLPAVEAMRLRIPVVVSADPALLEVTGGHAAVARDVRPETIVAAVREALARTPEQLEAAREHTERFSWRQMAATIRASLLGASVQRDAR